MSELEIKKLWALSTAHLREHTCNKWLGSDTRPSLPVAYAKGDYGWFVSVPDMPTNSLHTPNELVVIFDRARELGALWVEFDCDAPIVDDLVVFDW